MTILLGILEEGFVYAIMALGVYITYKILDFPDLSVDGTFPLGGAVAASLLCKGMNPWLTLIVSFLAGAIAGIGTGLIHVKLKVRDLLSGIIMMTALYSVNLKIAGKANLPIFSRETIFENEWLESFLPEGAKRYVTVMFLFLILLAGKLALDAYLKTRSGYLLRAAGDNEILVTSLAKDKGFVKITGLAIANAFAALAGCVYVQMNGFFEISTGTGTIVIGLASVIIGTSLFKNVSFIKPTTAVIAGSVLYKWCVSRAIRFGLPSNDLKLVTSVLFLIILVFSERKRRGKKNA